MRLLNRLEISNIRQAKREARKRGIAQKQCFLFQPHGVNPINALIAGGDFKFRRSWVHGAEDDGCNLGRAQLSGPEKDGVHFDLAASEPAKVALHEVARFEQDARPATLHQGVCG